MNKLEINPDWSDIVAAASKIQLNPDKLITDDEGNIVGCFVGQRFYEQQLKATGKCPGMYLGKPDKVTKADVVASLPVIVGLDKLTQKDLVKLAAIFSTKHNIQLPSGRLKAPYLEQLKLVDQTIDWNKLTVSIMTELIKEIQIG